jgi:hypothetical protein
MAELDTKLDEIAQLLIDFSAKSQALNGMRSAAMFDAC